MKRETPPRLVRRRGSLPKACGRALLLTLLTPLVLRADPPVLITGSELTTYAREQSATSATDRLIAIPTALTRQVVHGASINTTAYAFESQAGHVMLRIDLTHALGATSRNAAVSYGTISFVPATDLRYVLDGAYSLTGAKRIALEAQLRDQDGSGLTLFQSEQESRSHPGQAFILGERQGDYANVLLGSAAGTLQAGHLYEFGYRALIETQSTSLPGAGMGFIRLTLNPEPAALAFAMLLIPLSGLYRHRPRRPTQ